MIEIPTNTVLPDFEQITVLGERVYRLRFAWNTRDEAWFLTVSDESGGVLVAGRKLRIAWPALDRFQSEGLPAGSIIPTDTDGTFAEPGRDDLQGRVPIVFLTDTELAEILGG